MSRISRTICTSPSLLRALPHAYVNCNVPDDLRALPGTWQAQLPDYYGCIESIDSSVGRVRKILEEEHLKPTTPSSSSSAINGCHFMTRNQEYKRSTAQELPSAYR